jgi:hypothetical protein
MLPKLLLRRDGKQWYVKGLPEYEVDGELYTECGPYENRNEASTSRDSMLEVFKETEKP